MSNRVHKVERLVRKLLTAAGVPHDVTEGQKHFHVYIGDVPELVLSRGGDSWDPEGIRRSVASAVSRYRRRIR